MTSKGPFQPKAFYDSIKDIFILQTESIVQSNVYSKHKTSHMP